MASASSSSGSVPNAPRKNDVFISFRGEDTRYNFTSHLHAALNGTFLKVFRDDKNLEKGDEIKPSLIQAIKDSSVSVIVFSEDYASSKWCLDELLQIVQYRKDEGQYLIPIFYKVDPTDVRNQTGAYEEAFKQHKIDYQNDDPDRLNRWRAALSEAGNLSGFHCQTSTDESNLIKDIVDHVVKKLERLYNCQLTLKDAIGIEETIKPIEELLEKFDKVGIWGMGGLGKTTMAKALFAKLSFRYHNCYFLENIREAIERSTSKHVCNSLVSGLLGPDTHNNSSNAFGRKGFLDRKLGCIKAFVVLDDVENAEQLEDLKELCDALGKGSKVIITTRDMRLLRGNGYEIHEAKGLDYDNSRRLFIHKAFGPNHPEYVGYEHLIDGFVDYTQHNPLALKVLGTFLAGSVDEKEWDSLLRELREGNPDHRIQKVLRLSYDGLKYKEQQIFLDIACFLKGESEEFVEELLQSYKFYSNIGIRTLIDKALIVKTNGKVEMHDLLQEMGLQIVREESKEEPGKRSRLWDPSEIYDVLKNCEGEKEVQGIMFEISRSRPLKLTAKTFNEMKRIRFLKFYSSNGRVTIPTGLESISTKIRYFHWEGYLGKSLPSNFCAELLLELNLKESMVETLWEGVQDLANLRRLILQKCHNLRELPDLSKACSLESVDLSHCERLRDMDASLLSHRSLISLDFSYCSDLITELPVGMKDLSKLQYLSVKGCTALRRLPEFPPSFRKLIATDCTSLENVSIAKRFLFTKPSEEQAKCSLVKADHEKERVTVSYSFLPEKIRLPSIFL